MDYIFKKEDTELFYSLWKKIRKIALFKMWSENVIKHLILPKW